MNIYIATKIINYLIRSEIKLEKEIAFAHSVLSSPSTPNDLKHAVSVELDRREKSLEKIRTYRSTFY